MSGAKIGHRFTARVGLVLVGLVAAMLPIVPRVPARAATETSTEGVTIVRIPGVDVGQANAISSNGWVVGTGRMTEPELGSTDTGFLWQSNQI